MANTTAKLLNYIRPNSLASEGQFIGIAGFKTYVEVLATADFSATAPDVVCEDLTTAQDSIVNTPKTLTMLGEVADIFIETEIQDGFGAGFEKVLNSATPYLPQRTLSQIQKAEDFADNIENAVTRVSNVIQSVASITGELGFLTPQNDPRTIKEKFFDVIEEIYNTKSIISFDSLYRRYENYAITSFSYSENNDGDPGEFQITFKEIRIVSLDLFRNNQKLTDSEKAKKSVNTSLNGQLDSVVDKGINQGVDVPDTLASDIVGVI